MPSFSLPEAGFNIFNFGHFHYWCININTFSTMNTCKTCICISSLFLKDLSTSSSTDTVIWQTLNSKATIQTFTLYCNSRYLTLYILRAWFCCDSYWTWCVLFELLLPKVCKLNMRDKQMPVGFSAAAGQKGGTPQLGCFGLCVLTVPQQNTQSRRRLEFGFFK